MWLRSDRRACWLRLRLLLLSLISVVALRLNETHSCRLLLRWCPMLVQLEALGRCASCGDCLLDRLNLLLLLLLLLLL